MFYDFDGSISYADEPGDTPDRTCGVTYIAGPSHDPYSASCELDPGHDGKHDAPDPFGGAGRVKWFGGGSIAGDAVPPRDVEFIDA